MASQLQIEANRRNAQKPTGTGSDLTKPTIKLGYALGLRFVTLALFAPGSSPRSRLPENWLRFFESQKTREKVGCQPAYRRSSAAISGYWRESVSSITRARITTTHLPKIGSVFSNPQ